MSVSVDYRRQCSVAETIDAAQAPAAGATKRVITHDQFNSRVELNAASTVPVTKVAAFVQALTAGVATIDLTALPHLGGTVDGTGLKVQVLSVKAKAANANPITLSEGASNGYELLGNAWTAAMKAGQELLVYGNELAPDIAAGAKTIDLAGTGAQEVEVLIVLG